MAVLPWMLHVCFVYLFSSFIMGICKWPFGPVCPVRSFLIKLWVVKLEWLERTVRRTDRQNCYINIARVSTRDKKTTQGRMFDQSCLPYRPTVITMAYLASATRRRLQRLISFEKKCFTTYFHVWTWQEQQRVKNIPKHTSMVKLTPACKGKGKGTCIYL